MDGGAKALEQADLEGAVLEVVECPGIATKSGALLTWGEEL